MEARSPEGYVSPDTSGSPNTSFRHQLPQIASIAYNPKIAQSKAAAKSDITGPQNSDAAKIDTVTLYGATDTPDKKQQQRNEQSANKSKNPSQQSMKTPTSGSKTQRKSSKPTKLTQHLADLDDTLDISGTADELSPNINTDKSTMDPADLKLPLRKRGRKPKIIHEPGEGLLSTPVTPQPVVPVVKSPTMALKDIPIKHSLGDMFWAKVSGHPWWPCMVSYFPYEAVFTRLGGATTRTYRTYHVQFFGDDNERGWIRESALLPFEGREKLEEFFASLGKKSKSSNMHLEVGPRRRAGWEIAVAAAMEALPLTVQERRQQYAVLYEPALTPAVEADKTERSGEEEAGTGTTRTKAKLKMALKTAKTSRLHGQPGSSPAPQSDSANESSDVTAADEVDRPRKRRLTSDGSPPKRKHRRSEEKPATGRASRLDAASFEVFCQKHREDVRGKHPELDDEAVAEYLQQEWSSMNEKQRARYKSRYTSPAKHRAQTADDDAIVDTTEAASSAKKPGRVRHSSAKKQEVDTVATVADQKTISPMTGKKPRKTRSIDVPPAVSAVEPETPATEPVAVKVEEKTKKESTKQEAVERRDSEEVMEHDGLKEETKPRGSPLPSTKPAPPPILPPVEPARKNPSSAPHEMELEIMRLSAGGPMKNESLCQMCERGGEVVTCEGECGGTFHRECLGSGVRVSANGTVVCEECTSGAHTCFMCKQVGRDTKRCSVQKCGRFYHEECVHRHPYTRPEGTGFACPQHSCLTCNAANPKNVKANNKGRLYRCVRCPNAYHTGDFCVAAGSINLAGYNIVCSDHFAPLRSHTHHSHVNVSWCFLCNKGGTLLCCDSCPSAFHAECLNITSPDDKWFCPDCAAGHRPLYGDMIWVKLGNYRWWPGEVCHPRNVPKNIQDKSHHVGEFPVHFLGSHEYFWLHRGRVFLFQEGDKGSKDRSNSKGLAKIFHKAVTEATEGYKQWLVLKDERDQVLTCKNDKKPAPYKYVKMNVPVGSVQIRKVDVADVPRCECSPASDHPCGKDTDCLNRMLMYECHPGTCPAGERCENQNFTKRLYPECRPQKMGGRGWGLQTLVDVKKGDFVNEYVGDLVDEDECKARIAKAHTENISNFYFLTLDKNRIIDAGPKGNLSRFMNHCCQPNLETQKWMVNGDVRVGLFAKQDIPACSEVTFNYNLECLGNEKTRCQCQAANCSGFLGVRPRVAVKGSTGQKEGKKKRAKSKMDLKKDHDDSCFRCGEGGELVMCDKMRCPRVYHLECLNLTKPPRGKWVCPWHHCDECGAKGDLLCSECPNSFCAQHLEANVFTTSDGKVICSDHGDLIQTMSARQGTVGDRDDAASTNGSVVTGTSDSTDSDSDAGVTETKRRGEKKRTTDGGDPGTNNEAGVSRRGRVIKRKQPANEGGDDSGTPGAGKKRGRRKKEAGDGSGAAGKGGAGTNGDNNLDDAAMFSDEEFPSLVIDIPNV